MLKSFLIFNTLQNVYNVAITFDFLLLSCLVILFSTFGIVMMHKNLIVVFMCIELFIVAVSFNFFLSAIFFAGSFGFFFGYLLLILAGAESSLALALLTSYFFVEQHISTEFVVKLKG